MGTEKGRSQKRERDGDETEDERPERYQAVQEDDKCKVIGMEDVQSFNETTFEMNLEGVGRTDEEAAPEQSKHGRALECKREEVNGRGDPLRWTMKPVILHPEPNSWSGVGCKLQFGWHRCRSKLVGTS